MSVSKLKQQVSKKRNDTRFAAADKIALRRSSSVAHMHLHSRAPGSWLKSLGQQSRSPSLCLIFTRRFLSRDRDRRRNWQRTERRQKVSDAKSKKSLRSALQNTVGRVNRSRDLFLFGLIQKKVSAQAYPREYVHLVYLYIRAQGVGGGHTTCASKLQFFFCSGSFFFHASSSSQGGFSAHFAQCSYAPVKQQRNKQTFCLVHLSHTTVNIFTSVQTYLGTFLGTGMKIKGN